jgi:hypothetical protein
MKVKLENVRLAFPVLFEAKSVNGEGEPAFSANFLFSHTHPAAQTLRDAIETVGKDKFGQKWASVQKEILAKDRQCLHDGDTKSDYAGYAGNFYVSSRNKARPTIIDRDKSPLSIADGRPYAGCYVNAIVEVWAQDNSYGKRINASLRGVQFVSDGEAFAGGGSASEDEFDALNESAEGLV